MISYSSGAREAGEQGFQQNEWRSVGYLDTIGILDTTYEVL